MNKVLGKSILVITRISFIVLFSIGVVILGGYSAFLTYQTIFAVPIVRVPSIIDLELDDARQTLYERGLKMVVIDDNISPPGEKYVVIAQRPAAGTEIKKNRTVEVEIRAIRIAKAVPNLVGKTIAEAEELLSEYGYQIGDIAYTFHHQLTQGRIIAQTPPAGETTVSNGKVNILVSKGLY